MRYNGKGQELPDDTPVEVPVGLKRPLTLQEEIKRAIRQEMSQEAAERGMETFEEANDFAVDEDVDFYSPHEIMEEDEFQVRESAMLDRASKEIEDYERASRESGAGSGRDSDGDYGSGHRDNDVGEKGGSGKRRPARKQSKAGDRDAGGDPREVSDGEGVEEK